MNFFKEKIKELKLINLFQILLLLLLLILGTSNVNAQLKVGNNPKSIAPNTYFQVESQSGRHLTISKDSSYVGIGVLAPTQALDVNGKIKIRSISSGSSIDSILTVDSTGVIRRLSVASLIANGLKANNGLSKSGDTVQLGGVLTKATTISGLSATNKMSFTGTGADAFSINSPTFSVNALNNRIGIGRIDPTTTFEVSSSLTRTPFALNFVGSLGGPGIVFKRNDTLLARIISGSTTDNDLELRTYINSATNQFGRMRFFLGNNTLMLLDTNYRVSIGLNNSTPPTHTLEVYGDARIRMLKSGATTDSIVTADATTGELRRRSVSSVVGSTVLSNNGLSKSIIGDSIQLGGALTKPTTVTTSATNTLALAGLQSGAATDSILVSNPSTGVIRRRSVSSLNNALVYRNGISKFNDTVGLGAPLVSPTVITTTATNTLAIAGLQSGTSSDSFVVATSAGILRQRSISSVLPNGRVSCSSLNTTTNQLTISNSNIQTNSVVILQYEDPTGNIISTSIVSRSVGTSFVVQLASTPASLPNTFINYLIIN